jgi:prevent-host-death family protein
MLNLKEDIRSLSDFKRKTGEVLDHLRTSHRPVVLTVNGRAEIVVQDAESYQRMLDAVERLEANEGIRQGLQAVAAGKSKPARKTILAIKERRAVSR